MTLLKITDLKVEFTQLNKKLCAVNNVSLVINRKEIVGLVGESGSGKSMTALSIMRLIPYPGKITNGKIMLNGINKNLLDLNEEDIRSIRGNKVAMIFQDPFSSLNPCFTIGWQLREVLKYGNRNTPKENYNELILNTLTKVKLKNPNELIKKYPHQLSGGMRQRIVIAMALISNPLLILADEPTTALDVTTQYEILELINNLRCKNGNSFLFISHNLYLIAEICDFIYVMYDGQIVEAGKSLDIFKDPLHPYTKGLIEAIPNLSTTQRKLKEIRGKIESLSDLPSIGCYFQNRCKFVENKCKEFSPGLKNISDNRLVRCWRY